MFAETVRAYRQRLGLTQDDLAGRSGLSARSIRKIEAGQVAAPRPATVRLLAEAFGLTGADRNAFCQAATGQQPDPPPRPHVPAQLPPDVAAFTGREEQLARLDTLLGAVETTPTSVVISAVSGTAGVGKTALVVHWAHRVADRFPDGQLYVNLRGYDPDQPMSPNDALARFLTALGVAGQDVPLDLDDRAARYRSELAGRRMLILLDNAGTADQVRPLLPGTGACTVVVTSRSQLPGLVALHGVSRLDLDPLPLADAIALLRLLIGPRIDAEPEAAATLAEQCAGLPLALRIAAELITSRSTTPLAKMVTELEDPPHRLELLDADGDAHAALRSVFSWSTRHLPPGAASAFRLLGLHPGPDFDPYATAALTNLSVEDAHRTLDQLTRANLVHVAGAGRYGMHDLVRAYAAHLAAAGETPGQRQAALKRLLDYYLGTAAAAMDCWYPAEAHRRPRTSRPATPSPDMVDPTAAAAWLDDEYLTLVVVIAHAAAHEWTTYAIRLSMVLYRYLDHRHIEEAPTVHRCAYEAAERVGDVAAQANSMRCLGMAYLSLGQYGLGADCLNQALALVQTVGDESGEASVLAGLGNVDERIGHYDSAASHYLRALARYRRGADQNGAAITLTSLGIVEERLGHYRRAMGRHKQALAIFQKLGNTAGEAHTLNNIGAIARRLGRYSPSEEYHMRALLLFRQIGDRTGEAHALDSLGIVLTHLGRTEYATQHLEDALALFREINQRDGETWALNGLGEAAYARGRPADSVTYHTDALTIAHDIGVADQQARAHRGLGAAFHALGDIARARTHYQHALGVYTDLGAPEADDVRVHIGALVLPLSGTGTCA